MEVRAAATAKKKIAFVRTAINTSNWRKISRFHGPSAGSVIQSGYNTLTL
jgi:hypothetical protein